MWVRHGFQNVSRLFIDCVAVVVHQIKMPFYAVAQGRSVGIYETWAECEAQVKGFSGARYKKFDSVSSAKDFIGTSGASSYGPPKPSYVPRNTYNSYHQKKSYSTSSFSHSNGRFYGSESKSKSSAYQQQDSDDDISSDDGLDTILNKQMDDIEKRLKSFEKGVDKIEKKGTKRPSRSAIMIEPPQPKKTRRSKPSSSKEFDEDGGYVQVYTDGACSANGRSGAKAGIGVYWGDEHALNISEPVSGRATNNCGEIQAATRAMKQAIDNGIENLAINTDSQFLINSVTKWIPGWKRKGWKLKSGEPVKNEEDFRELDQLQNKLNIKWNYVEAHKGIHGNEKADQLAKAGASKYKK